eukprot:TRINITY_DN7374_c0_g1_i1.p1 TRINITY_DN7374_c0_g1~~TRINITY_DN7374_c0_g1_i1.p1  ORF type:complete len:1156 (+),score=125.17 TRINITY_DN7374_c0_g1_i1:110-3577(+)
MGSTCSTVAFSVGATGGKQYVVNRTRSPAENVETTIGKYKVLKQLGSGRYGTVHLCQHSETKCMVAIKQMNTKANNREVEALKRLDHQNIIKLYEVITSPPDIQYLVLEYLDGGAIMELDHAGRATREAFTEAETCRYLLQLVAGLGYLHSLDIAHRDIKPENILVDKNFQNLKLSDFGVCEFFESGDDAVRKTAGTPMFMSPEACAGEYVSAKLSDIWALGVTVYVFLFGRTPFTADSEMQLYNVIQTSTVVFPPHHPPLSYSCHNLLTRMLEKNCSRRITLPEIRDHPFITGLSKAVPVADSPRDDKGPRRIYAASEDPKLMMLPSIPPTFGQYVTMDERDDRPRTLLIVEDNYMARQLLRRIFESVMRDSGEGILECCADGDEAMDLCKQRTFFLVLMDVHMLRVHGLDASRHIRDHESEHGEKPIYIVGVTADDHPGLPSQCMKSGMNAIVQKPITLPRARDILVGYGFEVKRRESTVAPTKLQVKGRPHAFFVESQPYLQDDKPNMGQSLLEDLITLDSGTVLTSISSQGTLTRRTNTRGAIHVSANQPPSQQGAVAAVAAAMDSASDTDSDCGGHCQSLPPSPRDREFQTALTNAPTSRNEVRPLTQDIRQQSIESMKRMSGYYKRKPKTPMHDTVPFADAPHVTVIMACDRLTRAERTACDGGRFDQLVRQLADKTTDGQISVEAEHERTDLELLVSDVLPVWRETHTLKPDAARVPLPRDRCEVFVSGSKGKRKIMEDVFFSIPSLSAMFRYTTQSNRSKVPTDLFCGVCDGHGGDEAALFVKEHLPSIFANSSSYPYDITSAFKLAFQSCDRQFVAKAEAFQCDAGTTVMVAHYFAGTLWIAHVGDSRAVACRMGHAMSLTAVHNTKNSSECDEVKKRGGVVLHFGGGLRVNGMLLVTRSLGDRPCRQYLSPEPEVIGHKVEFGSDEFVILATDGLWDVMDPEEACQFVRQTRSEVDACRARIQTQKRVGEVGVDDLSSWASPCDPAKDHSFSAAVTKVPSAPQLARAVSTVPTSEEELPLEPGNAKRSSVVSQGPVRRNSKSVRRAAGVTPLPLSTTVNAGLQLATVPNVVESHSPTSATSSSTRATSFVPESCEGEAAQPADQDEDDDYDDYQIVVEALIQTAIDKGSEDNLSCAIIFFYPPPL